MEERHKAIIAVFVILQKDGAVLLSRRAGTGYFDGSLELPSGHVEDGESIVDAMIREAKEEIDVEIQPNDLELVHVRDRNADDGHRMDFYFVCKQWAGDIRLAEPDKCSQVDWFHDVQEREDVIPYIKEVLELVPKSKNYSMEGWR